jgi:hypothetical protein
MTGEYGPEVITPRQAGYVARSSAASPAVNVTVNVIGNPNPGAVQRETTAGLMAALDRHRALRQKVRRT